MGSLGVDNTNVSSDGQVPNFGGNWNNDSNTGPFQLNCNNSLSNSNANIGGRLTYISTIASYMGLLKWCNSYRLYLKTLYLLESSCNTE